MAETVVWGVVVNDYSAAKLVGERSQVRAVVQARSRAAAARYFAAAGLYADAGRAARHLAGYGGKTWNTNELALCSDEGQVYVGPTIGGSRATYNYIPWPSPQPNQTPEAGAE